HNYEGSITVLGETGTVRIGGGAGDAIPHWGVGRTREGGKRGGGSGQRSSSGYGDGHPPYLGKVFTPLRGESEPDKDGREGLRSLEVLIATYLSARDGRRVALPLEY